MEKSAFDSLSMNLMEQVVDTENMERAWKKVKANHGAPGPDGITLEQFPEYFRPLWPEIRQQLLDGTYWPEAVRRKAIAKQDGGERLLGIPNITERLIQQAILQVLTPIFDPDFSESSFGFRPKRSAHGAVKQAVRYIKQGYRFVVNMDLSKFFDRVQHDVLMSCVARKVRDKRMLRLIGRYLRAGVMINGLVQPSPEGRAHAAGGSARGPSVPDAGEHTVGRSGQGTGVTRLAFRKIRRRLSDLRQDAPQRPPRVYFGRTVSDAETEAGHKPAEELHRQDGRRRVSRLQVRRPTM